MSFTPATYLITLTENQYKHHTLCHSLLQHVLLYQITLKI